MTSTGQRSSGVFSPPGMSRTRPPGHARVALPAIIGVESWERFSFYGMQAIMAYYLYGAVTDGGLGLPTTTATVTPFAQMLLDPDIERAERRRVLAFIPLFIAVATTVLPWIRRLIAGDPASMAAAPTAGDDAPARVDSPRTPTPGSCR